MSNSMKTLLFLISLLVIFTYFTLTSGLSLYIVENTSGISTYYLINFVTLLGFIAMLYTQAIGRIVYTRNALKKLNVISVIPIPTRRVIDRLVVYSFPFVITIMPIITNRAISLSDVTTIVSLLIFIIIVEILFYLNSKTMKLFVTNNGFVIKGIDIRLDTPFPSNYKNPSGYYPFERIISFMDMNDKFVLYHSYDAGFIEVSADREELNKLKGLLISKKVIEKRR